MTFHFTLLYIIVYSCRLAEVFVSPTSASLKERILTEFGDARSALRILFATIAFGMGIDIPCISQTIHFGTPREAEDFVQESGRCGRGGQQSQAILIRNKLLPNTSKWMKDFTAGSLRRCRRKILFEPFFGVGDISSVLPMCQCCDFCEPLCQCGSCADLNTFLF